MNICKGVSAQLPTNEWVKEQHCVESYVDIDVFVCVCREMHEWKREDEWTRFFKSAHHQHSQNINKTHTRETFSKKRTSGRWVNSDKDMIRKSCVYNDQFFSVFGNRESVIFLQKSSQTEWKLYIQKSSHKYLFIFFCLCNVRSKKESKKSKSEKKPRKKVLPLLPSYCCPALLSKIRDIFWALSSVTDWRDTIGSLV